MSSENNLNLYIRITREIPCLYDKISPDEIARTILYRTTCFFDGMLIEHQFFLDTDYSYKFYIGRVSAISSSESSTVWMNYGLTDPDNVFFILFENQSVASVDEISKISFGTSTEGVYTARINIRCEVQYVNIAYAVVRINQISDIVDPNQTQPVPQNETNSQKGTFYLPSEWLIGLTIGASIIIVIVIVSYLSRKKR